MEKDKEQNKKEQNQEIDKQAQQEAKKPEMISVKEQDYLSFKEQAAKAQEYYDRLIRLQAEFDNARKRWQRDKDEFVKFANQNLVLELLNVLDDLQRAVEAAETKHQDLPAFLKGVEMILAHLYEMLKENGVVMIDAKGKKFDPLSHEALMQVETNDCPEHTVVEEMQKGYFLNGRVLRTSKVKVSKKKTEESS